MIRRAKAEDAEILAALAIQMWTEHDPEDLAEEFCELVMNDDAVCFVKYEEDKPIGFAQCQLRHDYVEGTRSSPVGYLEGVLFQPDTEKKAMPQSCCRHARNGQKKKAVPNLPAIASLTTLKACASIRR